MGTTGGENNRRMTGGIISLKIMVMKVWYLQVIWLVRDSIIKKVFLDILGKIMIKWLNHSGKKEPLKTPRMLKVNNQRKIKKLLMLFPVPEERILKLMLQ